MKIVLAYSGGLDTSICIPMMKEEYGYDHVVTVTVDVGQPAEDIAQAAEKAKIMGTEHYTVDAKEEFAAEFRKEYKDKDHCPCLKACRYHGNCKECVAIHRAHQEHVPNCMRPLINKKLKLMSELTEHTLANEIEAPHEILRK